MLISGRPVQATSLGGTTYRPKGTPEQRERIKEMLLAKGAKINERKKDD
jgi:hypothetical protein